MLRASIAISVALFFAAYARGDDPSPGTLAAGHSAHGEAFNEGPRQTAELMGGTGKVHFPVAGRSEEVQAFIDQGVGQLHGFWYFEAERSFRQAAALDPDCAIAYWGMAMANVNNNKRAKQFIAEAMKRKDAAQVHESLWIDALAEFYNVKGPIAEESKTKNTKKKSEVELRKQLVKRLEGIIYDYPDDIEAKAFLGGFLWASREKGLPITSHVAVDALLNDVLAVEPMHPAHHYRIHLWDDENSSQALNSAALCGPAAPAIAHMWHMPGHTYTKLRRYHDAAWQQEAASRVDHAYMIRNHVIPDQIHNYAHNQEWLIRTLAICGRVHDATRLAKDMIELPRHPRYNTLGKSGTSATFGRTRLVDLLVRFELWDELLSLADAAYLEPSDNRQEQAKRCRALGAAYFATGASERGEAQINELEKLLAAAIEEGKKNTKPAKSAKDEEQENTSGEGSQSSEDKAESKTTPAKRSNTKKSPVLIAVEQSLEELRGRQSLAEGDATEAVAHFEKAKVGKELLSRAHLEAGNREKAETFARQATDAAQGQVYPLANLIDVLHQLEKPDEAANALGRLRAVSATLDMDLPIVKRITPVAEANHLPADWRRPAVKHDDLGPRPAFDTLGPAKWTPPQATTFSLTTTEGRNVRLEDYSGRPVVLIFYLGFGCLHCVEQLQTFSPMAAQFEEAGISLLAISTDSDDTLEKSLDKVGGKAKFPIPLISDASLETFKAYRAFDDFEKLPMHATVVLDGRGRIVWQDIGPEPFTDAAFVLRETKRLLGLWK